MQIPASFMTAASFLAVVLAVGAVAALLHHVLLLPRLRESGSSTSELGQSVMGIVGGMFAFSVTFLVSTTWATDDRAREAVDSEARSIRIMETYAAPLPPEARQKLDVLIEDYVGAVLHEWNDMAARRLSEEAETELQHLYAGVLDGLGVSGLDPLLRQRLLVALDDLSHARQLRLSIAQEAVDMGQWFLVVGLGLLLLIIVAAVHRSSPQIRAKALVVTTAAVSIMLFVVVTYHRPFAGAIHVGPQPIQEASEAFP